MRTTNSLLFLGTWEYLNNENFNSIEFDGFKNESGTNAFVMPKKWIKAKKGNIRDYTNLLHLVILNNLQNINSELIEDKISQRERLIKLSASAKRQMKALQNNKSMKDLEILQREVYEQALLTVKTK